jgi:hypothetical protein
MHHSNAEGLPAGYTELEYIESSGTQYIDTGIKPSPRYSTLETRVVILNNTTGGFGCRPSSSTANSAATMFNVVSAGKTRLDWFGGNATTYSLGSDLTIKGTAGSATINGTARTFDLASQQTARFAYNYCLFAVNTTGTVAQFISARFYETKLWYNDGSGNVLEWWGIPAKRNSDNAIGMYDKVSGTFFTNSGTGTFGYGEL